MSEGRRNSASLPHVARTPTSVLSEPVSVRANTVADPFNLARIRQLEGTIVNDNSNNIGNTINNSTLNPRILRENNTPTRSQPILNNAFINGTVNRLKSLLYSTETTSNIVDLFIDNKTKIRDNVIEFANNQRASKKKPSIFDPIMSIDMHEHVRGLQNHEESHHHNYGNDNYNNNNHHHHHTPVVETVNENEQENHHHHNDNNNNSNQINSTRIPPNAHIRNMPRTSPLLNQSSMLHTQAVMADVLSPSVVGPTNIRFVTTNERDLRDRQVTEALNIISQSMEPPFHNVDRYRDWLLDELRTSSSDDNENTLLYKAIDFILGTPFDLIRSLWHYIILEIPLIYNLALLYYTFYQTPPLIFFVIGLTLFWMKVLYEIYRDIMHRDDPNYTSNVPKEMSIAAAISASMGFILNIKAQGGDITDAWWRGDE